MKQVTINVDGKKAGAALEATTFLDRVRGVTAVGSGDPLVLRLRSIHTVGLGRAIEVAAVDFNGCVINVRRLAPHRFAYFSGAQYLIEYQDGAKVPDVGAEVSISDV